MKKKANPKDKDARNRFIGIVAIIFIVVVATIWIAESFFGVSIGRNNLMNEGYELNYGAIGVVLGTLGLAYLGYNQGKTILAKKKKK